MKPERYLAIALVCTLVFASAPGIQAQTSIESGYVTVENGRLFYERGGTGPTMILLHDGLIHHEVWNHQVETWRGDHDVVRYDRRGYGKSDSPTERYSEVGDLRAIYDSLGIHRAILVGMSAGGRLAIDYALEYPTQVTHLVLVGAVVRGMGFTEFGQTRGGLLPDDIFSSRERYATYWLEQDPYEMYSESHTARAEANALMAAYPNDADFANFRMPVIPARIALDHLDEIFVPTLVLVGEHDSPDMHAHAGAIAAGIKGAGRVIVPGAGHRVPMEQPEFLTRAVATFLVQAKFYTTLRFEGVRAAAEVFRTTFGFESNVPPISEVRLNQLGYEHLFAGDIEGALVLFVLNIETYPESANTYDSYAEALLVSGDTTNAIINYEKSLRFNPDNTNATTILEELRGR